MRGLAISRTRWRRWWSDIAHLALQVLNFRHAVNALGVSQSSVSTRTRRAEAALPVSVIADSADNRQGALPSLSVKFAKHHERINIFLSRKPKSLGQPPDDREAERGPEFHRARVVAHDTVELHGAKSSISGIV